MLALGFAGMASASTFGTNEKQTQTTSNELKLNANQNVMFVQQEKIESKVAFFSGWCEVRIYRSNANGTSTLVAYSLTIVDSEAACDAKLASMMFEQQIKALSAE